MLRVRARSDARDVRRLLQAAALDAPDTAIEAWRTWRRTAASWWLDPASQWWFPLVWWNLRSAPIDASDRAMLRQQYHDTWVRNQHLLALAARLIGELEAAGIETLLLKGAALAFAVYERTGLRPFGDVDVLVRPHHAEAARAILAARGWRPLRPVADSSLPLRHSLGYTDGSGLDIDLHWVALGDCSGDEASDGGFWARAQPVSLDGVGTRVLCASDQLLHLCVHGLRWAPVPTGHWRADAITVMRRAGDALSWDEVAREAHARHVSWQMVRALDELAREHGAPVPADAVALVARHGHAWWEALEYRAKQRPPTLGPVVVQAWCAAARRQRQSGRGRFVAGLRAMAGADGSWQLLAMGAATLRRQGRATRRFDALGRHIRIDADKASAGVLRSILERLPPFPRDRSSRTADRTYDVTHLAGDDPGSATYRIAVNHRPLLAAPSADAAAELVASDLQTFLVLTAPDMTFVHAGVVSVGGRAIVLPGPSGSGKSTLVAALVRAGAAYASDEFAVVSADGSVTPYARPMVLRTDHGPRRVRPDVYGAATVRAAVPPAAIVFAPYRADARFAPDRLPPGDAVLRLLQHCPGAQARSADALSHLRALVARTPAWTTPRGDAEAVAGALIALATTGAPAAPA